MGINWGVNMIELIHEEFLDEMATIYKSKEYGIGVSVNPDSHRSGSYFKFYNNPDYRRATKLIRITFKRIDYLIHPDSKELWKLNSKDKKLLIKILKQESGQHDGYSNWDIAKYDWNCEYLEEQLNMKKYFDGYYDEMYADNPGYVPSTLKMPDYSKLNVD